MDYFDPANIKTRLIKYYEHNKAEYSRLAESKELPEDHIESYQQMARAYERVLCDLKEAESITIARHEIEYPVASMARINEDYRRVCREAVDTLCWAIWWLQHPNCPMPDHLREKLHGF